MCRKTCRRAQLKYQIRLVREAFIIVGTSEPCEKSTGLAAMMRLTRYMRDSYGRVKRFHSEDAALSYIEQLDEKGDKKK